MFAKQLVPPPFLKQYKTMFLFVLFTIPLTMWGQRSALDADLVHSEFGGDLRIYNLAQNGKPIGNIYWYRRDDDRVRARYFSSGDVYNTYSSWKRKGHEVIAVTGGGYMGGSGEELQGGLSVDAGKIVNASFDKSLDGLVIVERIGGIRVANIDEGVLTIYYGKANTESWRPKRLDLNNPADQEELLSWAVDVNATLFQTDLLCWESKLRSDFYGGSRINKIRAKRRFLALVYDKNDALHFVTIDINSEMTLADAALNSLRYFLEIGEVKELVALVNLERNVQDVHLIYNQNSKQLSEFAGKQNADIRSAKNLLVFYR